jgi:hypothetical protein
LAGVAIDEADSLETGTEADGSADMAAPAKKQASHIGWPNRHLAGESYAVNYRPHRRRSTIVCIKTMSNAASAASIFSVRCLQNREGFAFRRDFSVIYRTLFLQHRTVSPGEEPMPD